MFGAESRYCKMPGGSLEGAPSRHAAWAVPASLGARARLWSPSSLAGGITFAAVLLKNAAD